MGLVRLLLALSVVIAHSMPVFGLSGVGGKLAVQTFFAISGFYMSLIIDTKYIAGARGNWLFYSNRFLRIYPMYWTILLLSLAVYPLENVFTAHPFTLGVVHYWEEYKSSLDFWKYLYLISSNTFIVGLDNGFFIRLDLPRLAFAENSFLYNPHAYRFDVIPQAWTLGIEVLVYAIAPFLFRRPAWVMGCLLMLSVAARTAAYNYGLDYDPWTYRFFPFEIGLFLAGALAYRIYKRSNFIKNKTIGWSALALLVSFTVGYQFVVDPGEVHFGFQTKELLFLVPAILCIPAIFSLSNNWKVDRWLGELSYPIYLCHMIIVPLCYGDFGWQGFKPIAGSIGLSVLIVSLLGVPLERFRQARVRSKAVQHSLQTFV